MTTAPRHLVAVWNPSYHRNAMEEHLAVLLAHESAGRGDPYVWWGKVRSPNRQQAQAHEDDLRALARELAADGSADAETHLYLTDYQSLYVGEIGAIAFDLPEDEADHVPRYYAAEGLACDCWFKLFDIRRLVLDDLPGVIEELKALRNVHYADRPVSLYGGMVNLPLVVTRPDRRQLFDPEENELVAGGRLWAEFDQAMGGGVSAIERTLRDDLLGEAAWSALSAPVRVFIATGEKLYREHRNDPAFDFAPVLASFAKAIEVQANGVLGAAWPMVPREARLVCLDGHHTEDLRERRALMLRDLVRVIGGERERADALAAAVANGGWFTGSFPAMLDAFRQERNDGIHERRIDRRTATHWRNQLLGVGCPGLFVELAKVRPR